MSTALITHLDCLGHRVPEFVPERPERLSSVLNALDDLELQRMPAPSASDSDLRRCHPQAYIDRVTEALPDEGLMCLDGKTDGETYLSPGSGPAVRRAAGGAVRAVDAVLNGDAANAFVAVRPPGHHAEQEKPMGFCVFGNVAIAAKHALDEHGLERVAVLDFDVHHGNGTQALLQDDGRVLFVSSHQMPLWPGTGEAQDHGPHGTVLNIPLHPGSDGHHAIEHWRNEVIPRLRDHRPDLILVSAGFDAHQDDPLADLNWSASDFGELTAIICISARTLCEGRVVSVLEGGYDLDALALSARAHVTELIKAGQ